jgi:hypothetical protein
MGAIDMILNGVDFEEPKEVTLGYKQYKEMLRLINKDSYKDKHFKEVNFAPRDSICIGYEQASYGDWTYYVTPEGEYVCTYFSIGD